MPIPIPDVSVIICTFAPRRDIFEQVLDALHAQQLDKSRWELIVVDNNSPTPLREADILRDGARPFALNLIREPRQGNVFARQTGVTAARAPVLVFVDDDNILDPDYLSTGLRVMADNPEIGACGGITRGHLEGGAAPWKSPFLPFLGVRDYGPNPITSKEDRWGEWEPIGAGMVFRERVADAYVQMVRSIQRTHELGRKGNGLLAGEDSLLARAVYRLGLACSYQPALKLTHFIKRNRLTTKYLCRLMFGHGRSVVSLNTVLGLPSPPIPGKELRSLLKHRIATTGGLRGGLVQYCWDLGYQLESRRAATSAAPASPAPAAAPAPTPLAAETNHA